MLCRARQEAKGGLALVFVIIRHIEKFAFSNSGKVQSFATRNIMNRESCLYSAGLEWLTDD